MSVSSRPTWPTKRVPGQPGYTEQPCLEINKKTKQSKIGFSFSLVVAQTGLQLVYAMLRMKPSTWNGVGQSLPAELHASLEESHLLPFVVVTFICFVRWRDTHMPQSVCSGQRTPYRVNSLHLHLAPPGFELRRPQVFWPLNHLTDSLMPFISINDLFKRWNQKGVVDHPYKPAPRKWKREDHEF